MKSESSLYTESAAPVSQEDTIFQKGEDTLEASSIEVLPSEKKEKKELSSNKPQANVKRSWLPWKRADRRDQQLAQLRDGYGELIGLIRSISGHLEREEQESLNVAALIETLPPALNSFEKLATSQEQVTSILTRISSHMEDSNTKDKELLANMQGFNSTIKEVSSTNENALGALSRMQDRIGESDDRMKHLFEQASQTNEVVGSLMMRLEKRLFISNLILAIMLAGLIILGIVWTTRNRPAPVAPAPVAPATAPAAPEAEAPLEAENIPAPALPEEDPEEELERAVPIDFIEDNVELLTPLPEASFTLPVPATEPKSLPTEPVDPEEIDFLEIEF